ncbi:DUF6933 domain-containing protein [Chengkuizengella sediminis]|uniref:DUF6933 domain-containing protein n=1 Tax=Chengkuizengella sediminis TaxID=1885917 RepID=UPI001389737C|nr:hypothetical protein [Chengkuizengella sediminis]NDI36017.1 hypothetical protein [Chengkuizengella sediminis]
MLIQCTKKLADAMKIKLEDYTHDRESFYDWHANLFMFDRRKGVILMNNKTRYCIVLYGLKLNDFKKFDDIFISAIEETFLAEGLPPLKVKQYLKNCAEVKYTKTHDRSILGQINDFHIHISWEIEHHLPSESINLVELNKWTGKLMTGPAMGYKYPIDLLRKEIENI